MIFKFQGCWLGKTHPNQSINTAERHICSSCRLTNSQKHLCYMIWTERKMQIFFDLPSIKSAREKKRLSQTKIHFKARHFQRMSHRPPLNKWQFFFSFFLCVFFFSLSLYCNVFVLFDIHIFIRSVLPLYKFIGCRRQNDCKQNWRRKENKNKKKNARIYKTDPYVSKEGGGSRAHISPAEIWTWQVLLFFFHSQCQHFSPHQPCI